MFGVMRERCRGYKSSPSARVPRMAEVQSLSRWRSPAICAPSFSAAVFCYWQRRVREKRRRWRFVLLPLHARRLRLNVIVGSIWSFKKKKEKAD